MPSGQAEVASLNQKAEDVAGQMDEKLAVVAGAMHHLFRARVLTTCVKVAPLLQFNASMTHS
jgi:hypothetical protein